MVAARMIRRLAVVAALAALGMPREALGEPPFFLGDWVSENVLWLEDEALSEDALHDGTLDEDVATLSLHADGTGQLVLEDVQGLSCSRGGLLWTLTGDSLRLGPADRLTAWRVEMIGELLSLTAADGVVRIYLPLDTPPDTTDCELDPGIWLEW